MNVTDKGRRSKGVGHVHPPPASWIEREIQHVNQGGMDEEFEWDLAQGI